MLESEAYKLSSPTRVQLTYSIGSLNLTATRRSQGGGLPQGVLFQCKGQQASQCGGCREKVHLRHQEPAQVKGRGGGKAKDMSKKAILLSGPPGIGKTSSAMIISRSALLPPSNGLKFWFFCRTFRVSCK